MDSHQNLSPMLSPDKLAQVQKESQESFSLMHSPEDLTKQALYYKALGDPTRLKIIGLLLISDLCLCQLVELVEIPTSTMTHHLQVLDRGGILMTQRMGKFTLYAIVQEQRPMLLQAFQRSH